MAQKFKAKTLISNSGVFNNEVVAPNLVYNTGNQIISGEKIFLQGNINDGEFNTRISAGSIGFYAGPDVGVSIGYYGIDSNETLDLIADDAITLKTRGSDIIFGTSNTEKARLSDGNFGIGTDTPTEKLEVNGNIKAITGIFHKITANNLVYNTGNQLIYGNKTFISPIYFSSGQTGIDPSYLGGAGGAIDLRGGDGLQDELLGGNGQGGNGGSINLRGGPAGQDGSAGVGGYIEMNGSNGNDGIGGRGGRIIMNGGPHENDAGSIIICGSPYHQNLQGGSINLSDGGGSIISTGRYNFNDGYPVSGGSINLSAGEQGPGGSINLSNIGGNITSTGHRNIDGDGLFGGFINLSAGEQGRGGSIDLSNTSGAGLYIKNTDPADPGVGTIYSKINDDLHIRKYDRWEKIPSLKHYPTGNNIFWFLSDKINQSFIAERILAISNNSSNNEYDKILLNNPFGNLHAFFDRGTLNYFKYDKYAVGGKRIITNQDWGNNNFRFYFSNSDEYFFPDTDNAYYELSYQYSVKVNNFLSITTNDFPTNYGSITLYSDTKNNYFARTTASFNDFSFNHNLYQLPSKYWILSGSQKSTNNYIYTLQSTNTGDSIDSITWPNNSISVTNSSKTWIIKYVNENQGDGGDIDVSYVQYVTQNTNSNPSTNLSYDWKTLTNGEISFLTTNPYNVKPLASTISGSPGETDLGFYSRIDHTHPTEPNLIYSTGNQTVSGNKNFISRPTFNGTGLLTSGEINLNSIVQTTGNQTVSGIKTFSTGIIAPNIVYNTGDQTISGVKTFTSGISFSANHKIYLDTDNSLIISGRDNTPQGMQLILANNTKETSIIFDPDNHGLTFKGDSYLFFDKIPKVINSSNFTSTGLALVNEVILLTGNQTVSGIKTFATGIVAPNIVYNTGNQTISGIKTFSSGIVSNVGITGTNLVYNTGDQNITGVKTFNSTILVSNISGVSVIGNNTTYSNGYFAENISIFAGPGTVSAGSITISGGNSNTSPGNLYLKAGKSSVIKGKIDLDGNLNINPFIGNPGDTQYPSTITIYKTGTYGSATDILSINQSTALMQLKNGINISGLISGNNLTGVFDKINANNLVYNTGNQTISGVKTFATGIVAPNLVYNTGYQDITGIKSFADEVTLYGGAYFSNSSATFYNISSQDVDINLLQRPFINTKLSIGDDTGILGQSINSINNFREIKIWETGGYINQFSNGPFVRIGTTGVIIGEQDGTKLGIGTKFPQEKVHISGGNLRLDAGSGIFSLSGATPLGLPNNPLAIVGSGNTYVQVNIQNKATGTTATADLVITANNGTDASNYINLGINNSGYNDPTFSNGSGLDGYLFINGGSLDIGTQTANTNIEFHIGGTTADKSIAKIDNSGINVVSGTLRVNNTGVLLTGQNCFVINAYNTTDVQNAGHNYFGNINTSFSNSANNRRFQILESCIVKKASWTQFAGGAIGNPSQDSTGYFINTSTNTTGIISTTINTTSTSLPSHYSVTFNPPVVVNEGDYVVCSLYGPTYATTYPSGLRNSVNLYCYN